MQPVYRWTAVLTLLGVYLTLALRAQAASTIQLPIEVMGPVGTTASITITLPDTVSSTQPYQLWMQIHGLAYPDKISVRVNNGEWVPLDNQTVSVLGTGAKYGGIGGGFSTLKLVRLLPINLIHAGSNTLSFRFNSTAGFSSGFRVLAFNFQTTAGSNLLPASTFVQEDPNTWKAPLNAAADIAAGKKLYATATLVENSNPGSPQIKAHCGDCHAWDGRDLKYFNYSNNSIIVRSQFHGLSSLQGQQIASYIRSLSVPNPGRPWNPPYQPGPGLDSKPISQWAAGAGINAVLDTDAQMLPYLFPHGINAAAVATNGDLNVREIPVALQFPDWNRWLPKVHPLDAWGNDFIKSNLLYNYDGTGAGQNQWVLRKLLYSGADAQIRKNPRIIGTMFGQWGNERYTLLTAEIAKLGAGGRTTTAAMAENVYSTAQWQLVKTWELMQEFQLEGYGPVMYGPHGAPRTWFVDTPFRNSPFMLHIPNDQNGIGGSKLTNEYFSNIWYQVQLTLNDSNHAPQGTGPIDWPYVYGKLKDLYRLSGNPEPLRLVEFLVRGMQITDNDVVMGQASQFSGWSPHTDGDISRLVHKDWLPMFNTLEPTARQQIFQSVLQAWYTKSASITPAQYYASGLANPTYAPTASMDGQLGDKIMYMIPQYRAVGVDPGLINQVVDWAATVWPRGNWNALRTNAVVIH